MNQESRKAGNSFEKIGHRIHRLLATKPLHGERSRGEVEEQSIVKISCFQVATTNCEMNVLQSANRFQLNDDLAFNQEIQTMFADLVIAIEQWHWVLTDELDSAEREFNSERLLVN